MPPAGSPSTPHAWRQGNAPRAIICSIMFASSAGRAPCHAMPCHTTSRQAIPILHSTTTRVKPAAGRWLADASGRLRAGVPVPRGWRRPWWLVEADSMLHAAYVALLLHCLFNCEELIRTCIRHHSSFPWCCGASVHIYILHTSRMTSYIYTRARLPFRAGAVLARTYAACI